jgi:hypothetical protein
MTREEALKLRSIIEQASASLPDKEASEGASLFPRLKQDGALVSAGTRINWGGVVKRAAVDLWDTEANSPDNAPSLWEDISYREGIRIIPAVITAGAAFSKDELGWWGDVLYRSLIDANVYTPEQYPAGWEAQ